MPFPVGKQGRFSRCQRRPIEAELDQHAAFTYPWPVSRSPSTATAGRMARLSPWQTQRRPLR
eukprot:scaffold312105_cov42-Prasinocladus_malaysianus.AAC.2